MMTTEKIFLLYLCLTATACDPMYIIRRDRKQLTGTPESECVVSAVASVSGVKNVRDLGKDDSACEGSVANYIVYETTATGRERVQLYFCRKDTGEVEFVHNLGGIGLAYPKEKSDLVRSTMVEVEKSIETKCKVSGLENGISEQCIRVDCSNAAH